MLRGGWESRAGMSLVALVFLTLAVAMVTDTGEAGLGGTLAVASGVAALSLAMLWLSARSAVVIGDDQIVVRHFGALRSERIARADVAGVELVECGSAAMPALAPRLLLQATASEPQDSEGGVLTPLVVWTWWRSGTPRRLRRVVDRLERTLEL